MRVGLWVVGTILALATAVPLLRTDEWWIRVFDFPRLQMAVLLALVLVALAVFGSTRSLLDGALMLVLAASLAYQVFRIFPYTPLATVQVVGRERCESAASVRLLIANVLMDNRRSEDFLAIVRSHDPDLVLAVETDDWWDRKLAVLEGEYEHRVKEPLDNTYGMHLFSKLELGSPAVRFLVDDDVPSIRTAVRLRSGDWIDFFGVHPRPPRPGHDTEERDAEILIVGEEMKADGRPAIVAGDLNDVAWSHTTRLFQRISGTLDPRIGRGMFSTFHARYPMFRWPLDHVFLEQSFALRELKRLGFFGSDHFPILAELCYQPTAAAVQGAPAADREDREEAAEKIREGAAGRD